MILFDTDTLSLFVAGQAKVVGRAEKAEERFAISIIVRIEVLKGRFDSVLKADDGKQLRRAIDRLEQSERDLEQLATIPIDDEAIKEFEKLRSNRKLRRIGLADLLIASVALARKARLITRNLKDFEQVPGLQVENRAD